MPFVEVHWYEGRSDEQKAEIAKRIEAALVEVAGVAARPLLGEVLGLGQSGLHHRGSARLRKGTEGWVVASLGIESLRAKVEGGGGLSVNYSRP